MTRRAWLRSLVLALALVSMPLGSATWARPGGGHGFGGGSSGSGGGDSGGYDSDGGEGGAELIALLAQVAFGLTARYPAVMWPVWALVALGVALRLRQQEASDWTTGFGLRDGPASTSRSPSPSSRMRPRAELEAVREIDPDFSLVLFEDFVYALVGRAHAARGGGRLAELGAYLSEAAQRALGGLSGELAAVDGVIVGAMRYVRVAGVGSTRDPLVVELEIETNYTEIAAGPSAAPVSFWARERWRLSRAPSARSRPPERQRSFGCPDCGAPLGTRDAARCAHCGRPIDPADFDWLVETVALVERRSTPPALTGTVHESGTHLDTIVDPDAEARRDAIAARDANFTWPAFLARVRHVFAELQPAWSELDLLRARPYLSDNLFQTWMFWIDAYRRAGLRNVNERAKVTGVRLARVVSDRAVDAITVRLRATGLDYTIDAAGQVVSGSRDEPRDYSEYWTLVRGHSVTGPSRADTRCPRCGGPLAVNMAGNCDHCGARVSSGEFDWVLSRVEQDESYEG